MSTKFRSVVLTAVLGSAALLGGPADGRAQATTTPPEVLAALLVEVRGLRAAMEHMASAGPRVQLALGRLQLQEQRINTLVRRLEEIRASLTQDRKELDAVTEQMARLERASREVAEPEMRRDLEDQLKGLKTAAARANLEVLRLQNDEAALVQDMSTEQGHWTELNQRLETLERSLGGR
jgi:predicted  nucleic acid-binding Zn-ribbon protein